MLIPPSTSTRDIRPLAATRVNVAEPFRGRSGGARSPHSSEQTGPSVPESGRQIPLRGAEAPTLVACTTLSSATAPRLYDREPVIPYCLEPRNAVSLAPQSVPVVGCHLTASRRTRSIGRCVSTIVPVAVARLSVTGARRVAERHREALVRLEERVVQHRHADRPRGGAGGNRQRAAGRRVVLPGGRGAVRRRIRRRSPPGCTPRRPGRSSNAGRLVATA